MLVFLANEFSSLKNMTKVLLTGINLQSEGVLGRELRLMNTMGCLGNFLLTR